MSGIDVTVAAVIERDDRFLLVEEHACGRLVFNQPAGHLESGESLLDAVVRETLEETGHRFTPHFMLGVYLWHSEEAGRSFLRISFTGVAEAPRTAPRLDDGIVAYHWLSRGQLLGLNEQLRSPLVLSDIDRFRRGETYPLELLGHFNVHSPAQ